MKQPFLLSVEGIFFNNLFEFTFGQPFYSLEGYTASVILLSLLCDRRVEIYIIVIVGHFFATIFRRKKGSFHCLKP